ncbi:MULTISPECIES: PspA/IM30 family protein [Sporolactobacillus]|uniref:Phage shock protein A n=2 Tax=Sporolactobacillus inulinus TaxID=2078 RepID=A0A4Y3T744_9BACL|nr:MULTISPECIES: PspA/IM30 family protein [Sporolactobacillus]KLI01922.1 phage-shock protein [Sporolactobacillus inulinus CASD]MCQ2010360.1 PspA/IM30 family protein [Sporolactobacillus sp. STSJ-5]GAY76785.1 phage shock protein A [Sporolactobacillus inulinus]GEB76740.1 phage shock protein A [Sporolactobacillus inulinus]
MSLFKRLRDLTVSNIYAVIEKAEDPVKMTDQYLRDMQEDLQEAERGVAAQIALEKKFKALYEEQKALVAKREEQSHLAVETGDLDLARRVIEDKQNAERKMTEYKERYEQNQVSAENLRQKLDEMRKQVAELKDKRETLVARVNAAEAQKKINDTMSGFDSNTAMAGLKRMEEKTLQLEAEAEASGEVYKKEKSIDEEFENLGKDKKVEDELAQLIEQHKK